MRHPEFYGCPIGAISL